MAAPIKIPQNYATAAGSEPVVPAAIADLFAQPPLLAAEDPESFQRLWMAVAAAVQPKDVIEWTWIKDIADLLWEAQRLRRMKSALNSRASRGPQTGVTGL
jgi:hypothetical protein